MVDHAEPQRREGEETGCDTKTAIDNPEVAEGAGLLPHQGPNRCEGGVVLLAVGYKGSLDGGCEG
jgi:hypothetical protein